jgi:CheY-like chemotaxis protein
MTKPKTILFADDSDLLRDYLRTVLETEGMAILATEDGVDAVRVARERKPDAIVLDLLMPRLDGLSALLQLKGDETTRHIPVMMISGMPGPDAPRLARAYGAAEFLVKPLRVLDLVAALHRLLAAPAAPATGA